jgi:hypothetical protein
MAKSFCFKTRVHRRAMAIKDWPFVDTMISLTKDMSRNCLACLFTFNGMLSQTHGGRVEKTGLLHKVHSVYVIFLEHQGCTSSSRAL